MVNRIFYIFRDKEVKGIPCRQATRLQHCGKRDLSVTDHFPSELKHQKQTIQTVVEEVMCLHK